MPSTAILMAFYYFPNVVTLSCPPTIGIFSLHTRKHISRIQVPTCVTLHIEASLPWGNRCSAFCPTSPLIFSFFSDTFFWLVAQFVRVSAWPYLLLNAIFRDSRQL